MCPVDEIEFYEWVWLEGKMWKSSAMVTQVIPEGWSGLPAVNYEQPLQGFLTGDDLEGLFSGQ